MSQTPPVEPRAVHPTPDHEEVFYQGHPKLRGEVGTTMLWGLIGLVFMVGPIVLRVMDWVNVPGMVIAIGILLGLAIIAIPPILTRRTFYRITNYRIDFDRGLLFKKSDTIELWHVEDVSLAQGPLDRILNVGTIKVVSNDATNPILYLNSVQSPRMLFENIKQRIIAVKRQRGVLKIDGGSHGHDMQGN